MLALEGVAAGYGDVLAVRSVSLEVRTGECVALIGANGAGKTTTLRAITGLLPLPGGRIMFEGRSLAGLDPRQIVALGLAHVPEGRQVFPSLSVLENLEMGAMIPRARAGAKGRLDDVFAMFPRLKERTGQIAGTMSGGEQQMLAIGRCLMGKPDLVMFDEPSLGLAPAIVQAKPGATTTLMSKRLPPTQQQNAGVPKIAAASDAVNATTLLPRKGPQSVTPRPVEQQAQPAAAPPAPAPAPAPAPSRPSMEMPNPEFYK